MTKPMSNNAANGCSDGADTRKLSVLSPWHACYADRAASLQLACLHLFSFHPLTEQCFVQM